MKSKNRYPGVDSTVVEQVRFQARRLNRMVDEDIEDIEQTLLCEIWPDLEKYDASRGTYRTFIAKIVQSRANNLLYEQRYICPVSESVDDIPDVSESIKEIMTRIDVNDIISRLPKRLQRLCEELKLFSLIEVAHMNEISRSTLYRFVRRLRKRFGSMKKNS